MVMDRMAGLSLGDHGPATDMYLSIVKKYHAARDITKAFGVASQGKCLCTLSAKDP